MKKKLKLTREVIKQLRLTDLKQVAAAGTIQGATNDALAGCCVR